MPTAMDEVMPEVFKLLRERAGMDAESVGAAGIEEAGDGVAAASCRRRAQQVAPREAE